MFPFEEIDSRLSGRTQTVDESREAAVAFLQKVMRWVFCDGSANPNGLAIRALIASWILLPELHELNETQLAHGFGFNAKQSIGRHIPSWKETFPEIRSPHLKFNDDKKTASV
jgi:hypothetical protein